MLRQDKYLKRLTAIRKNLLERYDQSDVKLLPPTAMVYYNALHFACEHFYSASPGMALCCDIDRIVRHRTVDWAQLVQWSKEDEAGIRIQLALNLCNYFLKTPIPYGMFEHESASYRKLWKRIVDENNGLMIPQIGKFARLYVELLSDDKSFLPSLISRIL